MTSCSGRGIPEKLTDRVDLAVALLLNVRESDHAEYRPVESAACRIGPAREQINDGDLHLLLCTDHPTRNDKESKLRPCTGTVSTESR